MEDLNNNNQSQNNEQNEQNYEAQNNGNEPQNYEEQQSNNSQNNSAQAGRTGEGSGQIPQSQSQPQYNNYQQNLNNSQNKKSKAPIIIVIVVIVLLLLGCLVIGGVVLIANSFKNKVISEYDDIKNIVTNDILNDNNIKNTINSIDNEINTTKNTINAINNEVNNTSNTVKNTITNSISNNDANTTKNNTVTTNTTTSTTTTTTEKTTVIDAKTSSEKQPISSGTWGIASKYSTESKEYEDVYVKTTKTIRGEEAKKAVQEFTDKSSFYKYQDPKEGLEWVVVDYDMDFANFTKSKYGVEPSLSVSITGLDGGSVKYKGVTYFMIMTTNIGSSSYIQTQTGKNRVAFQMPIGCSDYVMKFGSSSGSMAYIKGE